jgi:hypothetical protein
LGLSMKLLVLTALLLMLGTCQAPTRFQAAQRRIPVDKVGVERSVGAIRSAAPVALSMGDHVRANHITPRITLATIMASSSDNIRSFAGAFMT